ncbi:MAG: hypothetical protein WCE69_17730, partial [Aestuariivirga sp.]
TNSSHAYGRKTGLASRAPSPCIRRNGNICLRAHPLNRQQATEQFEILHPDAETEDVSSATQQIQTGFTSSAARLGVDRQSR